MTGAYRFFEATVAATTRLSPTFTRVTLTGPDLDRCADNGYDQRIKLVLPLPDKGYDPMPTGEDWFTRWRSLPVQRRNPLRTYTLRQVRPDRREVDLDFAVHPDPGPATRWASAARPGDPALILGPNADFDGEYGGVEFPAAGPTSTVVLGGDETAVPAICAILERLDPHVRGHALLEVPDAGDIRTIQSPPGMTVTWLPRTTRAAGGLRPHGEPLVEAVTAALNITAPPRPDAEPEPDDELWDTPAISIGDRYVWLAGETAAMRTLRRHLATELGQPRSAMSVMGYWRRGRPESQD